MADEIKEKMEQIRLKNEELERKHKEVLQDELEAKKVGAAVQKSQAVSCKSTESHRYDNVELDYDVKQEHKELAKNPDYKPKHRRPILGKKQIDEIPSDPVNFLRDDGDQPTENSQNRRTPQNNNQWNRNRNPRPRNNDGYNEAASNEKSPHGGTRHKNNRPKSHNNPNMNNTQNQDQGGQRQTDAGGSPRKTHPQQLRERRSVQSADSTEDSTSEPNKPAPAQQRPKRPNNTNNKPRARPNKDRNEEMNDITVEVTDEVRSVKLQTSEKTFGTGRVRPKTENFYNSEYTEERQQQPMEARKHNKPHPRNRKPKGPPQPEFQHPILDKIVITKTSVQDRLLRSKMIFENEAQEPKIETEVNESADN